MPRGRLRSRPDEEDRNDENAGNALDDLADPRLEGADDAGRAAAPFREEDQRLPASSASIVGCRTSRPGAAVRSIPIAFIPIITIVRRQAVFPK